MDKKYSQHPSSIASRKWMSNPENKKKWRVLFLARKKKLKDKIFQNLGDKCVLCGFSDKRALQIDHKNGGGSKERKTKSWSKLYTELAKGERLNEFQILCANCNQIKIYENKERSSQYE